MLEPLLDHAGHFVRSLLPWHTEFDAVVLAFTGAYMFAQVAFCLALRRMAMAIPGPERMCNPIGLWVLVIPGAGAIGSFGVLRHVWDAATAATSAHHVEPPRGVARGFAMAYGVSRLLILMPGFAIPSLLLQSCAAAGFLIRLSSVAKSLRTPDVAVA